MKSAADMIQRWCTSRYGDGVYTVEIEMCSGGYCETCWTEYSAVVVRRKTKHGENYSYDVVEEFPDMSIVELLKSILAANEESNES